MSLAEEELLAALNGLGLSQLHGQQADRTTAERALLWDHAADHFGEVGTA